MQTSTSSPSQASTSEMDPYVIKFIQDKMILPKSGEDQEVPEDFINQESIRVYKIIEDGIFDLAYNQLPEEKQKELEDLVNNGATIMEIQEFMQNNVENLVEQIRNYMVMTTESYLNGEV